MKKCVCCKKELQTTDFYADNIKKDGLSSYCKKCDGEITKRRKRSFIGKARSIYSDQKKQVKREVTIHQNTQEMNLLIGLPLKKNIIRFIKNGLIADMINQKPHQRIESII
jgi:hypothetical protein